MPQERQVPPKFLAVEKSWPKMQNLALKSYTSEKLNSNTEIFALVIYLVRNFAVIC